MKLAKQSNYLARKSITYSSEDVSPRISALLHQEHTSIASKERNASVDSEKDKNDPLVSLAVRLSATGGFGASAYTFISIPVNSTQQEIAQRLINVGLDPENANSAAQYLINCISQPNVRNVIISFAAGVGFLTLIYKLDVPLWLKLSFVTIVVSGMLYLTHTYLPNRTPANLDNHPATEKVN
jgi:hypothetical protein